jgi:hypothetical protein
LLFLIQQNTYRENLRQAEATILLRKPRWSMRRRNWSATPGCCSRRPLPRPMWTIGGIKGFGPGKPARGPGQTRPGPARPGLHRGQAPFDGRIDRRLQDQGTWWAPGRARSWRRSTRSIPSCLLQHQRCGPEPADRESSLEAGPGPGDQMARLGGPPEQKDYPHRGRLDFASISLAPTTGTLLLAGSSQSRREDLAGLYARCVCPQGRPRSPGAPGGVGVYHAVPMCWSWMKRMSATFRGRTGADGSSSGHRRRPQGKSGWSLRESRRPSPGAR